MDTVLKNKLLDELVSTTFRRGLEAGSGIVIMALKEIGADDAILERLKAITSVAIEDWAKERTPFKLWPEQEVTQ